MIRTPKTRRPGRDERSGRHAAPRPLRVNAPVWLFLLVLCAPVTASAADALRGKALYLSTNGAPQSCAATNCHGTNVSANKNKILTGANNGPLITNAIAGNKGGMGYLSAYVNATDAADIGAYIANPNVTAAPLASLSPASLTFASTSVGLTSASQSVTITNSGAASLSLSSATLGGTHAGDWLLPGTGSCAFPGSLAPGASCTLTVSFKPTVAGTRSGTVSVAHNAAGSPSSVPLSGTGSTTPQSTITVSSNNVAFGDVIVGTASTVSTLTIGNSGNASLTLGALTFSGAAAGDFARSGGSCAATVAPGTSCTIGLTLTPAALGARSATLAIASDAQNGIASVSVGGTGIAMPVPVASLSSASLQFGQTSVGGSAPNQVVTLQNTGTAPLQISGVALMPTGPFTIAANTCGTSLAAGASCAITVGYRPTAAGAAAATLTLTTNAAGSPHPVAVSGSGVNGAAAAPALSDAGPFAFAATDVGKVSATRSTMLENRGTAPFSITAIAVSGAQAAEFARSGTCAVGQSIAPASSCTLQLAFAPAASGARQATLSVSTSSGTQLSIGLSGTASAVATATYTLTPASLDFGMVSGASPSVTRSVVLENTGTAALNVTALAPTGPFTATGDATSANPCPAVPFSLAPGARCTLAVTFAPTSPGVAAGELSLTAGVNVAAAKAVLSGTAGAVTGAAGAPTDSFTAPVNMGAGGCTVADTADPKAFDPTLAALILASLVALRRRPVSPSPHDPRSSR